MTAKFGMTVKFGVTAGIGGGCQAICVKKYAQGIVAAPEAFPGG